MQGCLRTGRENSLTPLDFKALTEGNCHYCGSPPANWTKVPTIKNIQYNGVDRIDNKKGYHLGNVVSCCKTCNAMKSALSQEQFIDHIRRVLQHHDSSSNTPRVAGQIQSDTSST